MAQPSKPSTKQTAEQDPPRRVRLPILLSSPDHPANRKPATPIAPSPAPAATKPTTDKE